MKTVELRKSFPILLLAILSMGADACERDTPLGMAESDAGARIPDDDAGARVPDAALDRDGEVTASAPSHVWIQAWWSNAGRPQVGVSFFDTAADPWTLSAWSPDATRPGVTDTFGACEAYDASDTSPRSYGPRASPPDALDLGPVVQLGIGDQPLTRAVFEPSGAGIRSVGGYWQTTREHGPYVGMDAPLPIEVLIELPGMAPIRETLALAPFRPAEPRLEPMAAAGDRETDSRYVAFAEQDAEVRFRWEPPSTGVSDARVWLSGLSWPLAEPEDSIYCNSVGAAGIALPHRYDFPAPFFGRLSSDFMLGTTERAPVESVDGIRVLSETNRYLRVQEVRQAAP